MTTYEYMLDDDEMAIVTQAVSDAIEEIVKRREQLSPQLRDDPLTTEQIGRIYGEIAKQMAEIEHALLVVGPKIWARKARAGEAA
jgi:hypothetical protein